MPKRSSTSGGDVNEIAAGIVEVATGERVGAKPEKNPAAVALGHLGGLKGGKARATALSARRRREIAKKAARARWAKAPRSTP